MANTNFKLSAAGKINFDRTAGRKVEGISRITYWDNEAGVPKNNTQDMTQAMILKYHWIPTTGGTDDYVDNVLNQAIQAFYVGIRRANMSLSGYPGPDVAKYLFAMAGLVVGYEQTVRDYRIQFTRKWKNMGYGKLLNNAVSNSDNYDSVGAIEEKLLKLKERIEAFPVIKLPIFDDWLELAKEIYLDDDIEKAGLIVFTLKSIPYWNVKSTDPYIGAITYTAMGDVSITSKISSLSNICAAYETDEDCLNIGAEIAKATGFETYKLSEVSATRVEPIFKMEMVDACHNACINSVGQTTYANYPSADVVLGLQEDVDGELKNTVLKTYNKGFGSFIVDSVAKPIPATTERDDNIHLNEYSKSIQIFAHVDNPTDKYIYDITRFMNVRLPLSLGDVAILTAKNQAIQKVTCIGTSLLTDATLYWFDADLGTISSNTIHNNWTAEVSNSDKWLSFAACPVMFKINVDSNRRYSSFSMRIIGDVDNFAVISSDQLKDIQRYRLLKAWKLDNNSNPVSGN